MKAQVSLPLPEIYKALCPQCKVKIEELVREKLASEAIRAALEGKEE